MLPGFRGRDGPAARRCFCLSPRPVEPVRLPFGMKARAGAVHHSQSREPPASPAPRLVHAAASRPAIIAATKVRQVTTPPQLAVITEHHGRRSVLKLLGELDVCSADQLRRAVGAVLEQHDPQSVTVDLSALTFADCACLSVLVRARSLLAERGHELVITGCQPIVRRLLTLTGIGTYLHLDA